MAKDKVVRYPGERATVSWHGGLCIHISECGRAKGDLFVGGRQPWCQPDQAPDDEVSEVVLRCPTGALTVDYEDGSHVESPDPQNTVHVAYNGPLFIRGDLSIEGAPDDAPGTRYRAALCRCGQSSNKPFCDNSHEDAGFKDYGAVGETGNTDTPQGGGLEIGAATDGPLMLKGNVTITSSSGRESWNGSKAFLCRCGGSNNKPFCDGQHKHIGFKSD